MFTEVGVVTRLERVSNSPDADQPGDFVAMVVEEIMFPDGWGLSKDLKPRCPKHAVTDEELAQDPDDLSTMRGTDR